MHEVSIRTAGFGGWVEGVESGGGRVSEGGEFVGGEEVRVRRCFARRLVGRDGLWLADDGVADGASGRGDPAAE